MKRFSVFAVCMSVLLLSVSALAQGPRQRGGHRGGKRMQQMDTNNDGVISRAEWKGDPQVFDKIDRNNDGSLTREEAIAAARQHGGERLKQMDTNNDRQISRDEWKGSDEAFNRLDVNNDGVITREEIRALRRDQKPRG